MRLLVWESRERGVLILRVLTRRLSVTLFSVFYDGAAYRFYLTKKLMGAFNAANRL
jgi:hypothetical protein